MPLHTFIHNLLNALVQIANKYKNTKRKLLNCNADIYFNKSCIAHKIIPKYARINIKSSNYSIAAKQTERQTRTLRVGGEKKKNSMV
jgi:hypothetical protein